MSLFTSFIIALFVTMVLIPPLMRVSGALKLVDVPTPRKAHPGPIPCSGGIAVTVGVLVPTLMWAPLDRPFLHLLIAALIVVLFGIWDDRTGIDYKWKFLGQLVAALVVIQGGVVIEHLPFFGLDPVPVYISVPVTVLFLVGITNAINMSDGLDGLAAGCALLTLGMIAILSHQAGGQSLVLLLTLSIMGSILGFLRYNTSPAIIYLGDAGSQFLGFIVAALTIYLFENVNAVLSPALPLLLLGVPILDTIWVMAHRVRAGRSPFRADRNHIHHKLLALKFKQREAVALIYTIHGLLVYGAFFLIYESDLLISSIFFAFSASAIGLHTWARRSGWQIHRLPPPGDRVERRNLWVRRRTWLPAFCARYMAYAMAAALIGGAAFGRTVPYDFSALALGLAGLLIAANFLLRAWTAMFTRLGIYVAAVLVTYLFVIGPEYNQLVAYPTDAYFALLGAVMAVGIRVTRRDLFEVTPQDLLIVFFALVIANLPESIVSGFAVGHALFWLVVLFYATEFLLNIGPGVARDTHSYRVLRATAIITLTIIAVRGSGWII
ncbi:MAG: MraY family glycosyltransferase [Rhodospirillales bacterium]